MRTLYLLKELIIEYKGYLNEVNLLQNLLDCEYVIYLFDR